ncbi:hypothetical protein WKK05_37935 (plasmid) [Nostoc sp. UHCC 0302]|uniref:Ig-like domain-containing protein n=1 Tax=Nostoc sp. UHCC 0302 TaxID=3134896 RepID=UPI00311CA8DE
MVLNSPTYIDDSGLVLNDSSNTQLPESSNDTSTSAINNNSLESINTSSPSVSAQPNIDANSTPKNQISLADTQIAELKQITNNLTTNFPEGYRYIYKIIKDNSNVSDKTQYWFSKAPEINSNDPNSSGNIYIRSVTANGLIYDGKSPENIQAISDSIARAVLSDIVAQSGIPEFGLMLSRDIENSLAVGGQTIGGWGGAFYYWNAPLSDGRTVGQTILQDPNEYEKFLTLNSKAISDARSKTPFWEALETAVGAEAPLSVKQEIFTRWLSGNYTGNPNLVNGWFYSPSEQKWFLQPISSDILPSFTIEADPDTANRLNQIRDIRLQHGGKISSLEPTIIDNPDGSTTFAFTDTSEIEDWSTINLSFDVEDRPQKVLLTLNDNTVTDVVYDTDNSEEWNSYSVEYNALGQVSEQTVERDDGSTYSITFTSTDITDPSNPRQYQLPGQSLTTTLDSLNFIKAIQNGQPTSIAISGLSIATKLSPDNALLIGASAASGAIINLINLENLLRNGDKVAAITTGTQIVSYAANLYKEYLIAQYGGDGIAALADNIDFWNFADDVDKTIPYISIFNSLYHEDYFNAALGVLSLIPAFQPFVIGVEIVEIIVDLFSDPPEPWGDSNFIWQGNQIGLSIVGDHGGDESVQNVANQLLTALNKIVSDAQSSSPNFQLGLIANRIPGLSLRNGSFILHEIDLISGQAKDIYYDRDGYSNAVIGSSQYFTNLGQDYTIATFKRGAIAPQWEVDTARLQTEIGSYNAGLTEEERAAKNGKLPPALTSNATTESFKPIILDLNGDGVGIVDRDHSNVAFDVDDSGFIKQTGWIDKNDGFLVLDRNFDGDVTSGKELFSNIEVAVDVRGLASLDWVDANADSQITAADPVYNQLRVWHDANSNGVTDQDETKTLAELGISSINYTIGSYNVSDTTREISSPELAADTQGSQFQLVENGTLITSTDGHASLVVNHVDDLSNLQPNSDGVTTYENLGVDIFLGDLLANDITSSNKLTITGVGNTRHGTAALQNGIVHFVPEIDYSGTDAGFDYYTSTNDNADSSTTLVAVNVIHQNRAPVIDGVVYDQVQVQVPSDSDSQQSNFLLQDDPYNGRILVHDIDDATESLTFSIKNQARYGYATIDEHIGHFSFSPSAALGIQDAFVVEIKDPHGAVADHTFIVSLPIPVPNDTGGGDAPSGDSPGTAPGDSPGTAPGDSPGTAPGDSPGTAPGDSPGTAPGDSPGTAPGDSPGTAPGDSPGTAPGDSPGTAPGDSDGSAGTGSSGDGSAGAGSSGDGSAGAGSSGDGSAGAGSSGDGGAGAGSSGDGGGGGGGDGGGGGGGDGGGGGGGDGGGGGGGGDPIVLDLLGTGFHLTNAHTSQSFFNILGDGWRHHTGWVSSGNGILAYDYNSDHIINHRGEIAFIDYKPGAKTDLEGLSAFDFNDDGIFSNLDNKWNQFGVWVDNNSDAVTDAGEFKTLDSLGINSINLTSDHQRTTVNGNIIHGVTQVKLKDGRQIKAADVSFQVTNQVLLVHSDGTSEVFNLPTHTPTLSSKNQENDSLTGRGNNTLAGNFEGDVLTGSLSADQFIFTDLNHAVDPIINSTLTQKDLILVSATGFGGGLTSGQVINFNQFVLGTKAQNPVERFIYNSNDGSLWFDVDGSGATPAVQIATFNNNPLLNHEQIFVTY